MGKTYNFTTGYYFTSHTFEKVSHHLETLVRNLKKHKRPLGF